MTSTELEVLRRRVQGLEDREAIRRTWNDYMVALDMQDLRLYGKLFTEDAVLEVRNAGGISSGDGISRGRDEILARRRSSRFPDDGSARTGHHGANLRLDLIEGDQARTFAYFFAITLDDLLHTGVYQHRFRREASEWLIAHLRITVTYQARLDVTELSAGSAAEAYSDPL